MKIAILLVVHLISVLLYVAYPNEVKYSQAILWHGVSYEGIFSAWYFGTEAFFTGAFLHLAQDRRNLRIERQLINVEIGLWVIRGLIYILDDLNIWDTNTKERLIIILLTVLVSSVIIGYSAHKFGFLRK